VSKHPTKSTGGDLIEEALVELHFLPRGLSKAQRDFLRHVAIAIARDLGALVPLHERTLSHACPHHHFIRSSS